MSSTAGPLVAEIRHASRELVRQLGLMRQSVAGTDLSLSAVHAILEIGHAGKLSSRELGEKLHLEKSTVSRLMKALVARGEIRELRSRQDLRMKLLRLSARGKRTQQGIEKFADAHVAGALAHLDHAEQLTVLQGLKNYSLALHAAANGEWPAARAQPFDIGNGYTPTIIARTVEMMHSHMHRHFDFGMAFESRIAADLAEFMTRIDAEENETWHARMNDSIVGSISIDGQDLGDGLAHLRWFVVSDGARGIGAGGALLQRALAFCDQQGFRETQLWTVQGLDAARRLYESHGFELAEEYTGDQWGTRILEQKFVRLLSS